MDEVKVVTQFGTGFILDSDFTDLPTVTVELDGGNVVALAPEEIWVVP